MGFLYDTIKYDIINIYVCESQGSCKPETMHKLQLMPPLSFISNFNLF